MDPPVRALVIVGALILVVGIGEAGGSAVGASIRARLGGGLLGSADRLAGAFLGVAQGLLVIWLAGGLLAAGPIPGASGWAQSSTAVRALSSVLPPPTEIATSLGHLLDASGLPQLFVGLEPFPASPVDTPSSAEARGIAANAIASTVKVSTQACSFDLTGTGFSVGHGYYVTNAHVVAGGTKGAGVDGSRLLRSSHRRRVRPDARHRAAVRADHGHPGPVLRGQRTRSAGPPRRRSVIPSASRSW